MLDSLMRLSDTAVCSTNILFVVWDDDGMDMSIDDIRAEIMSVLIETDDSNKHENYERLIPLIEALLYKNGIQPTQLNEIIVNKQGQFIILAKADAADCTCAHTGGCTACKRARAEIIRKAEILTQLGFDKVLSFWILVAP